MKKLARFFGGVFVFLLGATICTVLALFVLGAFCVSYPVLRMKPRDAKLKAIMDLLLSVATAIQVMKPQEVAEVLEGVVEGKPAPNDT